MEKISPVVRMKVEKALEAGATVDANFLASEIGRPDAVDQIQLILNEIFPENVDGATRRIEKRIQILPNIEIIEVNVEERFNGKWQISNFMKHYVVQVRGKTIEPKLQDTNAGWRQLSEAIIFAVTFAFGTNNSETSEILARHYCLGAGMIHDGPIG